jgi:hypothetical protein
MEGDFSCGVRAPGASNKRGGYTEDNLAIVRNTHNQRNTKDYVSAQDNSMVHLLQNETMASPRTPPA